MRNSLRVYFRYYDSAHFLALAGRGYIRTKLIPAKFGPLPNIRGRVKFLIRGEAVFGARFEALGDTAAVRIAVGDGARLTVGECVAINRGVSIEVWHDVRIGDKVMIAPNVTIIDQNRHEMEPGAPLFSRPVSIEDNVWLGGNVTVLPGVTIGAGSVIAAHSVVSRDIPPNSLAAGSPAKVIKTLNIPERWSHRYGYERNNPTGGVLAGLRRNLLGDPAIRYAAPAETQVQAEVAVEDDREAVV